jgi:hypothetical protein
MYPSRATAAKPAGADRSIRHRPNPAHPFWVRGWEAGKMTADKVFQGQEDSRQAATRWLNWGSSASTPTTPIARAPKLGASVPSPSSDKSTSLPTQRLSSERSLNTSVASPPHPAPARRPRTQFGFAGDRSVGWESWRRVSGSWLWTRCGDRRPEVLPQLRPEQLRSRIEPIHPASRPRTQNGGKQVPPQAPTNQHHSQRNASLRSTAAK